MAGKSTINGGFDGKITDKWAIFQHAMFDYQRVFDVMSAFYIKD